MNGDTDEGSEGPRTLGKGRMDAFSDGVFAIAITLLVLDLAIRPPGSPFAQFQHGWSTYVAYFGSFLTIGSAWVAHNSLTDRLERVDPILLRLNILFLMFVVFLPFPTKLVAEALDEHEPAQRVASVVYGLTLLMIRIAFAVLAAYARREHLRLPGADDADLQDARRKFAIVVVVYSIAIVLALIAPIVAIVLYLLIAVFLFVPLRPSKEFY